MADRSRRASTRSRRPPPRLDNGGDEHSFQQALRKSLIDQKRIIHSVPEAPVFHPTVDEFKNVLEYIGTIRQAGEAAGIVKIVPPAGWKPSFQLKTNDQKFPTKRQLLHKLQEGLPFDEGGEYTQQTYRQQADMFKQHWLLRHPEVHSALHTALKDGGPEVANNEDAAAKVLEEQYWRVVERASHEEVIVDYANDLDTKKYGSGFCEPTNAVRAWDLNNLYQQPRSLLSMLDEELEGVSYPWLYFGMLFSTFCWHNEDHFLYSINYMHEGEGKTWYGIPGSGARRFEEVMRMTAPQRFQQDRDLLHHLTTLTPPPLLMNNGVKVVHTVQHEGEFIVTFPKAYHSGFSLGWNAAEAANFAVMDWLPFGFEAMESYSKGPSRRPAIFSHDKLVWRCCQEVVAALAASTAQSKISDAPVPDQGFSRATTKAPDEQAIQNEINRLTGKASSSTGTAAAVYPPTLQQPSQRDLALLALGLKPPPSLQPAPKTVPVHVHAHTMVQQLPQSVAKHMGLTQPELSVLSAELDRLITPELRMRTALRTAGIREAAVSESGMVTPDGDLPSCHWCGHASYLSYVKCSCRPDQMRCLGHAHHGCVCYWPSKLLYTHIPDAQLLAMKGLLQCLVKQGNTDTASDTLITAMSRLASESKADRAPQRNAHRKRKMQEPPPTAAAAGLNKLKPSTVSLPPVGEPKQAQKQVASSVPAIVASIQRTGTCHPGSAASIGQSQLHSSGGLPANTVSQSSVSANKRAKHEQVNDSSTSYMHCLAQSTSAHHEDAETETDGSSHHLSAAQLPAHTTTSSSAFLSAPMKFFDPVKALPLTAHAPASSQGQAGILEEQKASPHRTAEQGIAQPAQSSVTASGCITPAAELLLAADNSMAALANAAAAASEGSAESSSSRAGTEDDKDAAAILRDLRSSPSPQPSPTEGTTDGMKGAMEQGKPEAKKSRQRTASLLPPTVPQVQCVACGRPGKAMLQCMACDCFYHQRCAAPETKRNLTDGVPWLCENCFTGQ